MRDFKGEIWRTEQRKRAFALKMFGKVTEADACHRAVIADARAEAIATA